MSLNGHKIQCCRAGAMLLLGLAMTGCSTSGIVRARRDFYSGNLDKAVEEISRVDTDDLNQVLVWMERGTIFQEKGRYLESTDDFIRANDRLDELETYSVSKGAASMVVNDNVQSFIGVPFERAMLHDFTALNHYALADWIGGAVESRRIIQTQDEEMRGDYPDDAFSRYIAGFGLLMVDDPSNAALQFGLANAMLPRVNISSIGTVAKVISSNAPSPRVVSEEVLSSNTRLVCFVLLGKSPSGEELLNGLSYSQAPAYAEIYANDEYLGRSHILTDVSELAFTTARKEAVRKAAKTASRIALKEGTAQAFDDTDAAIIGALIRIIMIGLLEQPDTRRWETLPRWIQVATVPCPADLKEYTAIIKSTAGITLNSVQVDSPIQRNGSTFVSFFRDLPQPKVTISSTTVAPAQ